MSSDHQNLPVDSSASEEVDIIDAATVSPDETKPVLSADEFGRLHPMSLLFEITSHVRTLLFPAAIAVFSAASGSGPGLIIAGIIFVPTLLHSIIRYFSLRYRIRNRELVVTEGIFFRRIRTVPVGRIQNIDLVQNVLHRIFGVAEVRVETASGTEPEATLRVLGLPEVEALREGIFASGKMQPAGDLADTDFPNAPTAASRKTLLKIPSQQLIRAGLASNRGTLLLGVLLGVFFQFDAQFDEQLERVFDFRSLANTVSEQTTTTGFYLVIAVGVVLVLLVFRLLGMVWYLLRFYGYELTASGNDLRIQCGLLTKVSATVPRKRIQFISIHRNLIMRWMKLASIRIETAGGAAAGSEDATKSVSSRWFVPVIPDAMVSELLQQIRPDLKWSEDDFDWQPVSPLAPARLTRWAVIVSVLIGIAGLAATCPWCWAFGVAAFPVLMFLAIKSSRSKRYARNDVCIVYRSGIFTRKTSVTFFEKIRTVRIDETPFDRRWQMATLCIDTAAAGPADHRIHIDYLTADFASSEFDAIVKKASVHRAVEKRSK